MKNEEINPNRMNPATPRLHSASFIPFISGVAPACGIVATLQNSANAPQISSAIRLKISQKIDIILKSFLLNMLRCPDFVKKKLPNVPVFPIVIVNCTAWCRGKQDLP